MLTKKERFLGAMYLGAIGDAMGSGYENQIKVHDTKTYYPFGKPKEIEPIWSFTDDTQLTLATCQALLEDRKASPKLVSNYMMQWYKERKLIGLGASTLKALQELEAGGHWSQVGRRGEYAAGNGAVMRMVPFAFIDTIDREHMYELCSITHHNSEAYAGCLSIVYGIKELLKGVSLSDNIWLDRVIQQLPDTLVKDRLQFVLKEHSSNNVLEVAQAFGTDGYVVNSIPFAMFSASKVNELGVEGVLKTIVAVGGDTDTNCFLAGQLMGCYLGYEQIPSTLLKQLQRVSNFDIFQEIIKEFSNTFFDNV